MKSKSDIKMVIESLYDLGILQKKKKRRRKKGGKGKAVSSVQTQASVGGTPIPQAPIFQNTSNLQNEYMREQLLSLENSNTQRPHIRELENHLENQRIFQNQTQRALLYLHNHNNPIIEEIGYDSDDNIDVGTNGGSNMFVNEGVGEPVIHAPQQSGIFSLFPPSKQTPQMLSSAQGFKNFAKETQGGIDESDDYFGIASSEVQEIEKNPSFFETYANLKDDEEEEEIPKQQPKPKRADERELLLRQYFNKGGDEEITHATRKKTILDAMKRLDKKKTNFEKLKNKYENILGGDDETLIDGNISVYDRLKTEVERMEGKVAKKTKK